MPLPKKPFKNKKLSPEKAYTTYYEIEYIDRLGTGLYRKSELSREELLRRYIKAGERRVDWGGIDRYQALAHAYDALKLIEGKGVRA